MSIYSPSLATPSSSCAPHTSCHLCPIIQGHKKDLQNVLKQAMKKKQKLVKNFRLIPVVTISNPTGSTDLSLSISDIECQYKEDHPHWADGSECFPAGPLYFDKLARTKPNATALDLEEKLKQAEEKVEDIQQMTFDPSCYLNDSDLVKICSKIIIKSLENMANELCLSHKKRKDITRTLENQLKAKLKGIQDKSVILEILTELQRGAMHLVLRKSNCWNLYSERIGLMGEFSYLRSVHLAMEDTPSIVIHAHRPTKMLAESLKKVSIMIESESGAEHDIIVCYVDGDQLVVLFGQSKVLIKTQNSSSYEKKLQEKVRYSLYQTRKDIKSFLQINPDLMTEDLKMIRFKTLSFLPVTAGHKVCPDCNKWIIFKEDITPNFTTSHSITDMLEQGLRQPATHSTMANLRHKLDLNNIKPGTVESFKLLLQVSARYVGLGSQYPIKTLEEYEAKKEQYFAKLEQEEKRDLEEALLISPELIGSLESCCFGFWQDLLTTLCCFHAQR